MRAKRWIFTVMPIPMALGCAGGLQESRSAPSPVELPTLEVAHQRQGPPLPSLPEPARTATPVRVTYRVCAEGASAVAFDVQPVFGAAAADAVLLPVLRSATWQLQASDGATCFLENLESTADGAFRTVPQPYLIAIADRVPQPGDGVPQLPQEVQQRLVGKSVVGLYRMCLTKQSGAVNSVAAVVGIPGADEVVTGALRTWRYKPTPEDVCFIEPLLFTLAAAPGQPESPRRNTQPYDATKSIGGNMNR